MVSSKKNQQKRHSKHKALKNGQDKSIPPQKTASTSNAQSNDQFVRMTNYRNRQAEALRNLNFTHYFLFLLIFGILVACYNIIEPYLNTIITATILAILFSPIHNKILRWVNGKPSVAAGLSCIVLITVVILPLLFMLLALIHQGIISFKAINNWVADGKLNQLIESPFITKIITTLENYLPDIQKAIPNFDPQQLKIDQIVLSGSKAVAGMLLNQGGQIIGNLSALIGKFFLMIFTFFFIIRDQETIFAYILHLMPLSTTQENQIIEKIKGVSRSVLLGTLVTALGQGAAGGIAFWIAGLPGLFWGMMMSFASLIPVVGTALIWVPAAVYLFISGHWGYGLFMVLWCVIVVGMIDNFVRPLFMKESAGMSTLLIFFSILGGINYFGLIGLLYGPLIFGLAMILLYIYQLEFESLLTQQDKS